MPAPIIRNLDEPVNILPSIGSVYASKLKKLDIITLSDLLHHYPFRYQDVSQTKTIEQLEEGETVTLSGSIIQIKSAYLRTGKTIQRAIFSDGSTTIPITWFNQPYLEKTFTQTPQVSLSGKVKRFGTKLTLSSPQYELIKNSQTPTNNLHTGRLVPVYPETAGVSSKWLRSKINQLLNLLPQNYDLLPSEILHQYNLIQLDTALKQIHFPDNPDSYQLAKKRLSFDELLQQQLMSQLRKRHRQSQPNSRIIHPDQDKLNHFINQLPFTLTPGQNLAVTDILNDLHSHTPMNRLIQGDVGSGKTAVAAIAAHIIVSAGYQAVFMVPTETLAKQHFATFSRFFQNESLQLRLATKSSRQDLRQADIVIGTHALLHRPLPTNIGLVMIDEQHRFGVKQRSQLIEVSNPPHVLSLTATPIPRTIALTLYSELDITTIKDMPAGRLPVKTYVVDHNKRSSAYDWIRKLLQSGQQAYVVCPLIYDQEDPSENEVKSAEAEFLNLSQNIFPEFKIGLIHGKLSSKEKELAINLFNQNQYQILVATPVIEVGIDVRNATIMLIEGAERFGLASLHQLRGRVGRGDQQSYCLLFTTSRQPQSLTRLKALETHHNGLELAEIDLHLRGQGDLYGLKQSGHINLKIASLHDLETIEQTHHAAAKILDQYPQLNLLPKEFSLCYNT